MNWRTESTRSRPLAGFVALFVTVGLLAILGLQPLSKIHSTLPNRRAVELRLISKPETKVSQPTLSAPSKTNLSKPATASLKRQQIAPESLVAPRVVAEHAIAAPQPALLPQVSPSGSPLKLDTATIHSAVSNSKSFVAQMALQSGQALPSHRVSASERLSAEVEAAGKSDCLAANERGSLLSLPLIAYAAITDKCK